jgi:tetratricopeptide (TPR) repeat protein
LWPGRCGARLGPRFSVIIRAMSAALHAFRADLADLLDEADEHDAVWLRDEAAIVLRDGVPHGAALQRAADGLRREGIVDLGLQHVGRLWQRFGAELARAGLLDDARLALEVARRLLPDDVDALRDAGTVAFQLADLPAARRDFEAVLRCQPDDARALAALAVTLARAGDLPAARERARSALQLDGTRIEARLALARADQAEQRLDEAHRQVEAGLASVGADEPARVALLDLQADLWDAQDRCEEAFAAWTLRNALLARQYAKAAAGDGVEGRLEQALRIAQACAAWDRPRPRAADSDRRRPSGIARHVFLLGFPRSGTTLLEKALAGHPACATLEEADALGPVADELARPGSLPGLASLAEADADRARAAYWAAVDPLLAAGGTRPVLVDKMPLYTVLLPVIARLFPDARILLAVRDPRDVVLSCYRRRMRLNAAMAEFLAIDRAAAYYDAAMRVAQAARRWLPLSVHVVRHESVVADFDAEVGRALEFVGLDWHADVLDVAGRAARRAVTPSDLQLRQGVNASGIDAWRRYRGALEPVLPTLAPWVRAWGYPED